MKIVWLRTNVCLTLACVLFSILYFSHDGEAARRGGRGGAAPGSVRVLRMARPGVPRATLGTASRRISAVGMPRYGPLKTNVATSTSWGASSPYGIFSAPSDSHNPFWTGSNVNPFIATGSGQNPFTQSVLTPSPFVASAGSTNPFSTAALPFNPFAPSIFVSNPFASSTVQALVMYASQMANQEALAMAQTSLFSRIPTRRAGQADLIFGTAGIATESTATGLTAMPPVSPEAAGDPNSTLYSTPFLSTQTPTGVSGPWQYSPWP